jgi:CRISPR-associated protein Csd2
MNRYEICGDPARRHDFLLLFDVMDGNPNGDPDAGNMPRVDPETMQGLVTDVCLKRKVRNFVDLLHEGADGHRIYVQNKGIALNSLHEEAYKDAEIKSTGTKQAKKDVDAVRQRMCARFWDVRMFGAVMTTGFNCGQVRGPVQFTFARSVDPVISLDVSITRVAVTRAEDAVAIEAENGETGKGKSTEMGRKPLVPYGLYVARGFFSAPLAVDTGVTRADLELFWRALEQMWEHDRSASRGLMACRGLYVFSHQDRLGNAPSHTLFERLTVRGALVEAPRCFQDYQVTIDDADLPEGVTLTRLVG